MGMIDYSKATERELLEDRAIATENIRREKERIADLDRALLNLRTKDDVAAVHQAHQERTQQAAS